MFPMISGVEELRSAREICAEAVAELESEGAVLQVVADRSVFIKSSIDEVRNTAILGGLLAVIVLFGFLRNARSTAIIAVSIPISLLGTFIVLSAAGLVANTQVAGKAGLAVNRGIVTDRLMQTADPNVFAIGDCTAHPSRVYGRRIRLESVPNALEQARVAVRNIRRDANGDLKSLLKEKLISEDDERRAEGDIQALTDEHVGKVDVIVEQKEKEMMEI